MMVIHPQKLPIICIKKKDACKEKRGVGEMKLIVNADDFGLSRGVNLGIIEAFKNGIVTSTTLMMNMPEIEHALGLLKENIKLGMGIHLVATTGRPISNSVPSLIQQNGKFHGMREIEKYARPEDIRKEFTCQIEKFLSLGIIPTHIDSHHHVHMADQVLDIVLEIAKKYDLPVRLGDKEILKKQSYKEVKTTKYFSDGFYGKELTSEKLIDILRQAEHYETLEIMSHPAYIDQVLLNGSSYSLPRCKELEILTNPKILSYVEEHKIELISFKDI
jgi:predicted glycoside hydrolase/deacetylase ChbG (UPF0249 family)